MKRSSYVPSRELGKKLSAPTTPGLAPHEALNKSESRRYRTFEVPPEAGVILASRIQQVIDEDENDIFTTQLALDFTFDELDDKDGQQHQRTTPDNDPLRD
ncbi:MAG TPA: hypothetical protein VK335_22240 [Bryobacteraceae bacterium]|nr:hypothetical protein [Bryobacteraceae bacterium]